MSAKFRRMVCVAGAVCAMSVPAKTRLATAVEVKDPQDQTTDMRQQDQEQRIKHLEMRLQAVESAAESGQTAVSATTATDLGSDSFPGSWPMFGSDTRIKLGGYLKTDMLYDVDGTSDRQQLLMSSIPVKGTPEHANGGYFAAFASETRFNIDVRRDAPGAVRLQAFIEGDFWSSGNQFRLRHAYMNAGDFLIGQTWTTLSFLESLPFIIDFAAGDALFGGRTTQVRYTKAISDRWKLAVGVEGLSYLGIENPNGFGGKASTQLPLLAVRGDCRWSTGKLWLGASAAQLGWDGGATGPTAKALQIDGVVAGKQNIGSNDYITWNLSYGDGSGENIIAFAGSQANAVLTADGELDTMPAFAGILGYAHKWNAKWSSNLCYAYGWLVTPETREPLALKEGGIAHVNLVWQLWEQFSTGIEVMYGQQRTQNNALGEATRIQAMAKFDF